jgi:hypothetical protein
MDDTTIGQERTQNPFVRYWRGEAQALGERVQVQGRPATLLVDAEDYDGGRKCQVRFEGRCQRRHRRGLQGAARLMANLRSCAPRLGSKHSPPGEIAAGGREIARRVRG